MTENNLKNMIENHELDNLMANGEELEKLKSSRTTEQVLEILKKYNYTETKEVFERELLEILQSIKLDDENMHNISGGRLMKTKNLSMVLGSLMALNIAGFKSAGAVTENQKNPGKYSVGSLLHNVTKQDVAKIGVGAAGIGLLWTLKEIVTSRRDNTTFKLSSIQQKIYGNTKKLIAMILNYVKDYIDKNKTKPGEELNIEDPEHKKILKLIGEIRNDWLTVYEHTGGKKLDPAQKKSVIENEWEQLDGKNVFSVEINNKAVEDLFYGLPVGKTWVCKECLPYCPKDCNDKEMVFLGLLWKLDGQFRSDFLTLTEGVEGPNENDEEMIFN